jgi:DNA-binding NarL/FixJ family response regulator
MTSTATAPDLSATCTPAGFAIVAGDLRAHRTIARLLGEAGFVMSRDHPPLVVVATSTKEDARLREVRQLVETHPAAVILAIVPAGVANAGLRRVLLAGATGIVLDEDAEHALVPTARAILAGQLAVPMTLGRQIAPRPLSHREKQILALVVLGKTNREIAHTLFLAESTVKTHLSSAFRKIDARSRSEAVVRIQDPDSGLDLGVLALVDGVAG